MWKDRYQSLADDSKAVISAVILILAFGMGALIRVQFIADSNYPINDGGLFYRMANDLINNDFRIPEYTTYNNDQIPFAYPPLAFYAIAILKVASRLSLMQIFRFFPLLINLLVLPAYFLLLKTIIKDSIKAALAMLFFALLPRTYEWFLMGGGATRGLGFLFAILAIKYVWDIFSGKADWKGFVGAILFSGACVLSHPETALFVVFMAGVIFIYHKPSWGNFKKGIIVAVGVLACILPWIIRVYSYHGLEPFLGAGGTGHGEWLEIKNFITLNFGFENGYFLTIYAVFALIAVFLRRDKLTYYFGATILLGYYFFPRSGPNLLTIIVSPLAAFGFSAILEASARKDGQDLDFVQSLEGSSKSKLILLFVVVYLFLGAFTYKYLGGREELMLTDDLVTVYDWLDEHADEEEKILFYPAIGTHRFWWNDFAAEWFPALTDKANLTTVQGYEWVEGRYQEKVLNYIALRGCLETGPVCVDHWETQNAVMVDYLVLSQITERKDFVENFIQDPHYQIAFPGLDYLILAKE